MKLRFSPNHLTFRLTQEECSKLSRQQPVLDWFTFPDQSEVFYQVSAGKKGSADIKGQSIQLVVTPEQIKALKLAARKTGIQQCYPTHHGEMIISLEIDLIEE